MLQDIIEELAKPEYSELSDAEALALIKSSPEVIQGAAQAGDVLGYLAAEGLLIGIKEIAANSAHPLQNACEAIMITLIGRTQFDLPKPSVKAMLQLFVTLNVISSDHYDGIMEIGQTPKFQHCTLRLVRQVRGKTNTQVVTGWTGRGAIKVTVDGELFEPITPTCVKYNATFPKMPLGRVGQKSGDDGVYIIDLENLRPKQPMDIEIELGAPNTFTVELI
ncbi:MAG: hypothetical protein GY829_05895 [Gammaproteobacteria bacterium]|nr:hypothetical protein [Gammaproteobacteria bacterium]MCP4881131.1 hypothetical protein [Gammaproteobacteria bacterium]